jgi:hypothetical protein
MEDAKLSEIESELFSLVNSIINLRNKYNEGIINHHFFNKAINNAMNGLLKINLVLKEKNIAISQILDEMDFKKEFNGAVKIVKENLNEDQITSVKNIGSSIFKLPGMASEITSSFITIMDALKLESQNHHLIVSLLKELKSNFKKFRFPGLDYMQSEINGIYKDISKNKSKLMKDYRFRELIVDRLYQLFKEFQTKLDVKT